MRRNEKASNSQSHNSAPITLTYGDGSTTELDYEVMEGTEAETNDVDSSLFVDEHTMTQGLLFSKSQPLFPTDRPGRPNAALPGRARRRGTEAAADKTPTTAAPRRRRKRRSLESDKSSFFSFISSMFSSETNSEKSKKRTSGSKGKQSKHKHKYKRNKIPLHLAIAWWYILGVVSISTTKLLLTPHLPSDNNNALWFKTIGGIKPLMLSVQQFSLGAIMLRFLLEKRVFGYGIARLPRASSPGERSIAVKEIFLAGAFFSAGFVATNFSFHSSTASFVETVKASEPITSAAVAVFYGIEILHLPEIISLIVIVLGVLTSTIANSSGESSFSQSLSSSLESCIIVMAANLCFSFRGLHQKLLRGLPEGSKEALDDVNLQFRMQSTGALIFSIPAVIFELLPALSKIWSLSVDVGLVQNGFLFRYITLSIVNAFAFASYNLASTHILSRISVVHHAAFNCIRRIFAIIVTSIVFGVPITFLGTFGIILSIAGFLSFTHFKTQRKVQPRPLSSLLPMSVVEDL